MSSEDEIEISTVRGVGELFEHAAIDGPGDSKRKSGAYGKSMKSTSACPIVQAEDEVLCTGQHGSGKKEGSGLNGRDHAKEKGGHTKAHKVVCVRPIAAEACRTF